MLEQFFLKLTKVTCASSNVKIKRKHNPVNSLYKQSASLNFFSQFHKNSFCEAEISVRRVELD